MEAGVTPPDDFGANEPMWLKATAATANGTLFKTSTYARIDGIGAATLRRRFQPLWVPNTQLPWRASAKQRPTESGVSIRAANFTNVPKPWNLI